MMLGENEMAALKTSTIVVLCGLLTAASPANASPNLLRNGSFDTIDNGGVGHLVGQGCGPNGNEPSGAKYWVLCNDQAANTSSARVSSTLVNGGWMMHVTTDSVQGGSGLVQTLQTGVNPTQYLCVWLKVISGAVAIGAGDASSTADGAVMLNHGTWEVLNVGNNPSAPTVSEAVIFSYEGPAEFYVESAKLSGSHGQCVPQ
jgi:hypothetical protein